MKPEVDVAIERMINNKTIKAIVAVLNKPTETVTGQCVDVGVPDSTSESSR